ncbi:MAG TPA: low temperature requirement protein A [Vicinamibacterales bacterium]|nr:low temperature requirement protein A [Vicinamibacterales bacterium]
MLGQLARPLRLRYIAGEPGRKVTWLELFFDLAFVAAVAKVGSPLADDYSFAGLCRYAFLFFLIWWAWSGHSTFATRFDSDDAIQRSLTVVQIFVVAVMAVNAKDGLDSRSSAGFAAAYAIVRFLLVAQYLRARSIPESRRLTTAFAIGIGAAAVCWLLSAVVPPPVRYWLWAFALVIDVATPIATAHLTVQAPPDAAHLPERYGLFTIILLGESLVAIMQGMESQEGWSLSAALSAFLGMLFAFLVWWWYFDGARGAAERTIRSHREARAFMVWSFAHLPLYLGIAVAGVGLEHVVKIATRGHLHLAEVTILCAAVALLMLALTTIGVTSESAHRQRQRGTRTPWQYTIALAPLALIPIGGALPLVALVATLTMFCWVQVVLSAI